MNARNYGTGLGMTLMHEAESIEHANTLRQQVRAKQREYKSQLDAAVEYRAHSRKDRLSDLNKGILPGRLEVKKGVRHEARSSANLLASSSKIGSVPAPFLNRKKKKWVAWSKEEVVKQRERNEMWANLGLKGGQATKVNSKLDPITHEPIPAYSNRPRRGQDGGVGASRESVEHYQQHSGLVNRIHGQQGLQFVPNSAQVLRPFNVEDLAHGAFSKRKVRQNITLPFSPLRKSSYKLGERLVQDQRRHTSISPALYAGGIYIGSNSRPRKEFSMSPTNLYSDKKPGSNHQHVALVSISNMRRRQFREALIVEMGRNGGSLYETDVRRICNLFFLPSNAVNTALRNAMSILSNLGDNTVNLEVFFKRLFGDVAEHANSNHRNSPTTGISDNYRTRPTLSHNNSNKVVGMPFGIGYRQNIGPDKSNSSGRIHHLNKHPVHDYINSFQDETPHIPPHLESQRKLVLNRRHMQRRGAPKVAKSWFLPGEDLVPAPYPTYAASPPSAMGLRKTHRTSGTQTQIDGEYGTSRSIMESIVNSHLPFPKLDSGSANPIGAELPALGSPINYLRSSGITTSEALDVRGLDFATESVLDPLDSHGNSRRLILIDGLEETVAAEDERIEKNATFESQDGLIEQLMAAEN